MKDNTALRKFNIAIDFSVSDPNLSKDHLEDAIWNYLDAGNIDAVIGSSLNNMFVKVIALDAK